MRDLQRAAGLLASLAAAVAWALLAARTPSNTYHFAPLVVAAIWAGLDGSVGAGLTQRRVVNRALGGLAIAAATGVILEGKGDLEGPTFWDSSDGAPVLIEHLLFAAIGAIIGAVVAIRAASTPPRAV